MLMGIHVKLLMASQVLSKFPSASMPLGVFMKVSQESAMKMMAMPTRLRPRPISRCTHFGILPHP